MTELDPLKRCLAIPLIPKGDGHVDRLEEIPAIGVQLDRCRAQLAKRDTDLEIALDQRMTGLGGQFGGSAPLDHRDGYIRVFDDRGVDLIFHRPQRMPGPGNRDDLRRFMHLWSPKRRQGRRLFVQEWEGTALAEQTAQGLQIDRVHRHRDRNQQDQQNQLDQDREDARLPR